MNRPVVGDDETGLYSPANYDLYTAAAKPKLIFINQRIMINKMTGCIVISQQDYNLQSRFVYGDMYRL